MASDFSNSLNAIPLEGLAGAAPSSRIADEVESLFAQFRAPVLRYLLSLRIPIADAEGIVQDVFLSLFQHLRQGKSRANLQGWIFKVAHNLALKQHVRARRQFEAFRQLPDPCGVTGTAPDPERRMETLERQRRLLAVMRALPEQDQSCLSLRAEGLRYREIAEVLGISLGSVAASLEKSLSRLMRANEL